MAKYLRMKSDGFIYDWNHELAKVAGMELFETDKPVPEKIPDLMDFMSDEHAEKEVRKGRRKAAEVAEPTPE